jgi:hypothetical protein
MDANQHQRLSNFTISSTKKNIKSEHNFESGYYYRHSNSTRIPDPPFSSFGPSCDYGMDLCLEVYLWAIYPYFTTFRVQLSPSIVFTFDVFFSAETTCTARWHVFYIRNRPHFSQLFCLQVRSVTPWQSHNRIKSEHNFESGYYHRHSNSGPPFFLIWSLLRLRYGSLSGSISLSHLSIFYNISCYNSLLLLTFVSIRNRPHFSQLFCLQVRSVTPWQSHDRKKTVSERQTT